MAQNLQGHSYEVCSTNIGTNFRTRITYSSFWDMCHYTPAAYCYVTRIYEIRVLATACTKIIIANLRTVKVQK